MSSLLNSALIILNRSYECLPENENERHTKDNITNNKDTWTSLYRLKNGVP